MTCYTAEFEGNLEPCSEIEEIKWLSYSDRNEVSEVDKLIFDFLKETGELIWDLPFCMLYLLVKSSSKYKNLRLSYFLSFPQIYLPYNRYRLDWFLLT